MVALFALALVAGILASVPYIVGVGPRVPRPVTAALLGTGLGGLSSSYAGWSAPLAALAAVGAAAALAALAVVLEPGRGRDVAP